MIRCPRDRLASRRVLLSVVLCFTLVAGAFAYRSSEPSFKKRTVFRKHDLLRIPRGGSDDKEPNDEIEQESSNEHEALDASMEPPPEEAGEEEEEDQRDSTVTDEPAPVKRHGTTLPQRRKVRRTSDVIASLENHAGQESHELRKLIADRAQSYMEELSLHSDEKIPHPKRVLHFVAPKIPAIKNSPDLMLRVKSSRAGIDAGVAACAIGTVARLCELYDRQNTEDESSVGSKIVKDRRFQQLVECVLCGVDVKKRMRKAEQLKGNGKEDEESRDIEEVLDEEHVEIEEGLSVQDACRAAWGIALLGGFHTDSFSEVPTNDILTALSLRTRELLLARLQLLRQGDSQKQADTLTLVERLDQDAEELAEDAASAMWVFACVKACTGVRSVPLFEACCSILCQNPAELRERAQATKEGLDGSNFEANDVLERLARSERDEGEQDNATSTLGTKVDPNDESDVPKDALLDWLSPNEVTDVLWALALHGSSMDTDSKQETKLSETAAAFREIAFDRLVGWLQRDIDVIEEVKRECADASLISPETLGKEEFPWSDDSDGSAGFTTNSQGEMIVEVVDAAALLATTATETDVVKAVDASIAVDPHEVDVKQVEVVDAATLLACTPEKVHLRTEAEVLVTSAPAPTHEASVKTAPKMESVAESFTECASPEAFQDSPFPIESQRRSSDVSSRLSSLLKSGELSFSPHDLCSIAWAVTDLRDPLLYLIVDLITQIFASLGKETVTNLPVGDLSNLAWGIARSATNNEGMAYSEFSETPSALVTRWIVDCVLSKLNLDTLEEDGVSVAVESMLKEFQPPELGRLMWSLSGTVANHLDPFDHTKEQDVSMSRLAELALVTASSNLSIFCTEDLARITWAFLELCDTEAALSQPLVAESLGRAISVVESSLLMWEAGPGTKPTARDVGGRAEEALHYSTFFGKRFPLLLLNHRINEHEDEDEENLSLKVDRKKPLPLLRDLPVDPSTLCKVVSGFTALTESQQNIMGGWTLVRVAVRLLASKNGQLMEQCPIRDVVRLCHACATWTTNGREREQVIRLFARRVVQFMNDALDPDRGTHGKKAARLAHASPWEMSILIWSLGELGARHFATDENRGLAYRKLRLVTDQPLLTEEQLNSLSPASTANLLHGIVSMGMTLSDPFFVSTVLHDFEDKLVFLQSGEELTNLAETIVQLRRSVASVDHAPKEERSNESADPEEKHPSIDSGISQNLLNIDTATDELQREQNSTLVAASIMECTDRLLVSVAEKAIENIHEFSGSEMRKLLLIYLTVPFQADELVNAVEEEIDVRMAALTFDRNDYPLQDVARCAAESALQASKTLSARPESASAVSAIKNGIKAIFGLHGELNEEPSEEVAARLAQVAVSIHRTTILTQDTLERMERLQEATGIDAETLSRGVEQGAAVELGRCRELIACYRRMDFATGSHGGRYDSERRKDIGKRILSRLFP